MEDEILRKELRDNKEISLIPVITIGYLQMLPAFNGHTLYVRDVEIRGNVIIDTKVYPSTEGPGDTRFVLCTFERCTFHGEEAYTFQKCTFIDCEFEYDNAVFEGYAEIRLPASGSEEAVTKGVGTDDSVEIVRGGGRPLVLGKKIKGEKISMFISGEISVGIYGCPGNRFKRIVDLAKM